MTNRERVAALFREKAANGLVDVKFYPIRGAADIETVCGEVLAIEAAVQAGRSRPLIFNDRHA